MLFGLGGPIISAGAPKAIVSAFEGSTRGLAMGIYMTGPAIGAIVSLTLTNSFFFGGFRRELEKRYAALEFFLRSQSLPFGFSYPNRPKKRAMTN